MVPAYASDVIVDIAGAIVGEVVRVRPHPHGISIWLADIGFATETHPLQIVFGGARVLRGGELVAVAPPGSRVVVEAPETAARRRKKMRVRRYRGERSHGMLCSLDELGWTRGGPDEVAILCDLDPGQSLDDLPRHRRPEVVVGWERAKLIEKMARTRLVRMFDPLTEAVGA
jgi:tRNA-binding EMAP/Myf-like protein